MQRKFLSKIIAVIITVTMLTTAIAVAASAATVTNSYDAEFAALADSFDEDIHFAGKDGGMANYYIISSGNGENYMGSAGGRYNYYRFTPGKETKLISKSGFDLGKGFTFRYEIFTNIPDSGTSEVSVGKLKLVTDYSTCTLYIKYGSTELARLETGYEAGSVDFQTYYTYQDYTLTYTDGVLTVSRLANGFTKNSQGQTAIVACGDNIVWTLADGTTAEKIPMPDYADFGYAQIGFYASSTVGGPGLFYVVPVGFRSNWNGNLPVFSAPMLSAKCGFTTVQGYVDFLTSLNDNLTHKNVEFARKVFNKVMASGSAGLKNTVSAYESYITAAEKALSVEESDYDITATVGGSVYCNGAPFVNDTVANRIVIGQEMTLNAVADSGYTFSHWADAKGGIVSKDATLTVTFGADTTLTAVFEKANSAAGEEIVIRFRDHAGNIKASVIATAGESITLPALPYSYGYTCTGWLIDGVQYAAGATVSFTSDTVISAAFKKDDTLYSIEISGAEGSPTDNYTYNTLINLKFDNTLLQNGQYFAGWTSNGAIISYDEEYSFFVAGNTTIAAVISKTAATVEPLININDVSIIKNGAAASFLMEHWLPDDCTMIETGAVYTNSVDCAADLKVYNVNGKSIRKAVSKYYNNHGQMRLNIGSSTGAGDFYVAAFMTYKDADGNVKTIYTSVYSAKTTAANS